MHLSSAGPERLANAGALFRDDPERRAQWSRRQHFEAAAPAEVRSTVGAGDAASAGLLCGLLGDLAPEPSLHLAATTAAARVSGTLA